MSFYEKYLMLCDKNKKTPSGAALEMGLSKTTVNRWKNGGGITDATILKVATFFGVSKEELKGDPEQTIKNDGLSSKIHLGCTKGRRNNTDLLGYARFVF